MAVINLTVKDRKTLATWIGIESCKLDLLYSAVRDGCTPKDFHEHCDKQSPVLVLASNTAGYVFGGYATQSWASTAQNLADTNSFLFTLKKANRTSYLKFPALNTNTAIHSYPNYGPCFGNTNGFVALLLFDDKTVMKYEEHFLCAQMSVNFNYGYKNMGQDNNALHGDNKELINIEVYKITESRLYDAGEEWRKGQNLEPGALGELKEELQHYSTPRRLGASKANILLVGSVGAGKSSFINTVMSAFRGHVTGKAAAGSAEHSVTSKFRQYKVQTSQNSKALNVRLCDTMGLEDDQGLNVADIPYILDGNVKDGFQFNPAVLVTPEHPGFQSVVKFKDRTHVVALVVDATSDSMSTKLHDKLRQIKSYANQRDIPVAVILTKIDELCPYVSEDVSTVFRSMNVKECVDYVAERLGIPKTSILPVKSYDHEVELCEDVDTL